MASPWSGRSTRNALVVGIAVVVALATYASIGFALGRSPTKGPIPNAAFKNGTIVKSLVPDFIPALDTNGHTVGYIAKDLAIPDGAPPQQPSPVYAPNLKTLVGYMYPGIGFLPLGVDPSRVRLAPVTTIAK